MAGVSIKVSGDFEALKTLKRAFRESGKPPFRKALSRALQAEALGLVRLGFSTGQDPYGKPWAPADKPPRGGRARSRFGRPLVKTGRLRDSWKAGRASSTGFVIRSRVAYAAVYHYGGPVVFHTRFGPRRVDLPARKMVPDEGLSGAWKWRLALRVVFDREVRQLFRGRHAG